MGFILFEKQFLDLNTDADGANTEMSMPIFSCGQHELLHNSFFQHDSELNKTMKLVTPMINDLKKYFLQENWWSEYSVFRRY